MISVVIPVRNGAETLGAQLDALLAADRPDAELEILIADNGSNDETVAIARSYSDRLPIRIVSADQVSGPGAVRNVGVRAAAGEWLLFCDADDEVDPRWLVEMERCLVSGSDVIGGPISYVRLNTPEIQAWRGASGSTVGPALAFMPFAHSSNLGITREAFDTIGGFDEDMRPAAEDIDFSWRAQLLGYEIHEVPDAIVHYRLRGTLPELWRQAVNYGRSEALLFQRYRDRGLQRRSLGALVREVGWMVSRVPFLLPRGRRGAWVRKAGQQWGRLLGSVRLRTVWW